MARTKLKRLRVEPEPLAERAALDDNPPGPPQRQGEPMARTAESFLDRAAAE